VQALEEAPDLLAVVDDGDEAQACLAARAAENVQAEGAEHEASPGGVVMSGRVARRGGDDAGAALGPGGQDTEVEARILAGPRDERGEAREEGSAVIWRSGAPGPGGRALALDPTCTERFRRDATVAASLSHRSLVRVHAVSLEASPAFLVMELLDGKSLARIKAEEGQLPRRRALALGRDLLEGLAAIQRRRWFSFRRASASAVDH
jgi:hypothetical protein